MAHRLCAQLLYTVVTVYLSGQWVIFYIARYTSKPSKLYWECLLHALRHMYGHRHIGLTLGGVGASQLQTQLHTRSPNDDERLRTGTHVDAGHAEDGPSTGGHTLDCGETTIHSLTGQHRAVTLGTTDSEMYELSRGVAALMAFKEFMTEFGYPQEMASPAKCDNAGGVFKATAGKSDKRSMYMRRRVKFVQEAEKLGLTITIKVRTEDNRADILTKMLSSKTYARMRDKIMNVANVAVNIHIIIKHQSQ